MKLVVKYPVLFEKLSVGFATLIRVLLNVLLIIIICALVIGTYKAGYDLFTSLNKPLDSLLQQMLLDVVFILALVEVTLILLGYLKDGYVHVRYIVDTVLIIMLNEVVRLWFKHPLPTLQEAIGLTLVLAVLFAGRVAVTRLAPRRDN